MELLLKTRRVADAEEALAKLKALGGDASQDEARVAAAKQSSEKEKEEVEQQKEAVEALLHNAELDADLASEARMEAAELAAKHHVTAEALGALYRSARYAYSAGSHEAAAALLKRFVELAPLGGEALERQRMDAQWGKLACDVLLGRSEEGFADVQRMREHIETLARQEQRPLSNLQLLHLRVWLLHWALFVYLCVPAEAQQEGNSRLVDLFTNTTYMNALQTEAPHLLRYLAVAVITDKRRQRMYKETLARSVRVNEYLYTDSLTRFVNCVNYADFDGALAALTECRETLFPSDMLVAQRQDDFVQSARLLLFENYVHVHCRIDAPTLADKLSMSPKEVEQWVVDLIRRNSHFDARIDSATNTMVFGTQHPSLYQDVIEYTKTITEQTDVLSRFMTLFEEIGTIPTAPVVHKSRN